MDARKNFAFGTLAAGINSAATSCSVGSGEGARFPATPFNAVIWQSTDYAHPAAAYHAGHAEIVRVTGISTDTLTITRAQESTSAVNLNTGGKTYQIWAGPTALYWTDAYSPGEILTTRGDTIRRGSSAPERVAIGNRGNRWLSDGTDPGWFGEQNFYTFFDDFLFTTSSGTVGETGWQLSFSSGVGASGDGEAGAPGIQVISTSTSSSGIAQLLKNASTTILFGGGVLVFEARVKLSALSDGTDTFKLLIGWLDNLSVSDGVFFEYTHSANSGQWQLKATNNSSTTTTNSSSAVSSGAWMRLTIVVAADGSSAEFFVDGVSVGTVSSNIPTGTGRETQPRIAIWKSAGTTARTLSIDYTKLGFKPTTAR